MASLRELRSRIKSVNATKKITKAQELIATSRITKAQARVEAAKPYAAELEEVLGKLASATDLNHPMLTPRENVERAAVLVITSDRGMCGGYNYNVFKTAKELVRKLELEGKQAVIYVTGGKGMSYFKFRGEAVAGAWDGFSQDPQWAETHDVRRHMIDGFLAGSSDTAKYREGLNSDGNQPVQGFDELHIVFTRFESMLSQVATAHQLLPITPVIELEEMQQGESLTAPSGAVLTPEYEFEPDADTLLEALLPAYVSRTLYSLMLEASASESAARRTAMKAATDNANELVKNLSRVANQARQAQITQEISEIVGGAAALTATGESD